LQLAVIAALKEDYETAFRWIDSLVGHPSAESKKAEGYGLRALLLQLTGRPDEARAALRTSRGIMAKAGTEFRADLLEGWMAYDSEAWAESRKDFQRVSDALQKNAPGQPAFQASYALLMGMVDHAEGKRISARSNLAKVESLMAQAPTAMPAGTELNARRLHAAILVAEGNLDEAISILAPVWPGPLPIGLFNEMVSYYCPLAQDDLARIYVRKQDWDRAIAEYKMLTVIGPGHQNRRLIHPIYHYRLAQVCEKKGMKVEAIAEYERFLKLWEKADPGRSELKDARKRLSELKGERSAVSRGRT
jgi:tetratricopeptide (TPR) repeat protein